MDTQIAAIIPARYDSTRFKGKPLVKIAGKPMIEWVYRQVEKCKKFTDIIVATDDKRIAQTVDKFGGQYQMTSRNIQSGTDRVWEVLKNSNYDAVINIQGDEPLISEKLILKLYDALIDAKKRVVSAFYVNKSLEDFISRDIVKVVLDNHFQAIYFSRSPVPHQTAEQFQEFNQHIGIYGYWRDILERFVSFPPSKLEKGEKLEQLRFLSNSIMIKLVESDCPSIGVDVPEDIERIENLMGIENEKD
jgi:3-deoxy-manno-octulosonate cytidylyltransferase (CMP-KDO synthetase)